MTLISSVGSGPRLLSDCCPRFSTAYQHWRALQMASVHEGQWLLACLSDRAALALRVRLGMEGEA